MYRCLKICGAAAAGLCSAMSCAKAAVVCDGNFQIVDGSPVSTPFCQDENLAALLRQHGEKASAREIRRRPELKRQACTYTAASDEPGCAEYLGD